MTKKITVTANRYAELVGDATSFQMGKEMWKLKELNMSDKLAEQRKQIDCVNAKSVKEKQEKLRQCYYLAIEMNDPMAAAQIAIML